jgi:hypothetical protein
MINENGSTSARTKLSLRVPLTSEASRATSKRHPAQYYLSLVVLRLSHLTSLRTRTCTLDLSIASFLFPPTYSDGPAPPHVSKANTNLKFSNHDEHTLDTATQALKRERPHHENAPGAAAKRRLPPGAVPTARCLHGVVRQQIPETTSIKADHGNRLQGRSITLTITPYSSQPMLIRRYTLPINLICSYSTLFRAEIARLDSLARTNKKRKIEETEADELIVETEDSERKAEIARESNMMLHLENVDHATFGLFLKFIYQGSYAASVDILSAMARSRTHASPYVNTASQLGSSIAPSLIPPGSVVPASVHGKFPDLVPRTSTSTREMLLTCSHSISPRPTPRRNGVHESRHFAHFPGRGEVLRADAGVAGSCVVCYGTGSG